MALRTSLTSSFTPYRRSSRDIFADVSMMHVSIYLDPWLVDCPTRWPLWYWWYRSIPKWPRNIVQQCANPWRKYSKCMYTWFMYHYWCKHIWCKYQLFWSLTACRMHVSSDQGGRSWGTAQPAVDERLGSRRKVGSPTYGILSRIHVFSRSTHF